MNLKSCSFCGVVINWDTPGLEKAAFYNHDQDKQCDSAKCPVCDNEIPNEEWEVV